jgi:predicted metal-dependent enzyme (double-stranded beta helix superfamily)
MEVLMFEAERFVADCRAAFAEDPTHKAVREVLASPVSNPAAVLKGLGEPKRAEIQKLFHSNALTIINVVWAPGMMVMPHNHRMWAVIGIYTGREDNVFWRRVKGTPNKIEAAGSSPVRVSDCAASRCRGAGSCRFRDRRGSPACHCSAAASGG